MPLISIVLTSFNHAKFINEAIGSVINQTFTDWEMFIFDDASNDDSWDIIKSYSDPRIALFRNTTNQGPIYAFNKVIFEFSTGKYIAIHHSDDVWELNKLQKQVDFLEANPNIGAVFSNALAIDERGEPLADQTHFYHSIFSQPNRSRHEWLRFFFLTGNALCHPSILIRKQCYVDCGPYLDTLAQLPDFDMWVRLCAKYEIHVMEERLINFRVLDGEMNTSGSRPTTRTRHFNECYKVLQRYRTLIGQDEIFKIFPNFSSYDRGEETDSEFVLSQVCLESDEFFLRHLLAIEIIFDIFNNPLRRQAVERLYSFTSADFIAITGRCDIFSREELLNQQVKNVHLGQEISVRDQEISVRDQELGKIYNSTSWRITAPLRHAKGVFIRGDLLKYTRNFIQRYIKRLLVILALAPSFYRSSGGVVPSALKVLRVLKQEGWRGVVQRLLALHIPNESKAYKNYIAAMEPKTKDLEAMSKAVSSLIYSPKFSIVVPVYNVEAEWLTRFIKSVLAQVYPHWELCIADDHSTLPHVRPLLEHFAAKDNRIRLIFRDKNGHISAATNSALELVTGDFMCLMDNDDEIAPHALYEFAQLLNRDPSIDMIYSDEDKLDIKGNRYEPFFKPDWSPESLEGCMYTAHFACYRMSLVQKVGGFRSDFNGAQDYDFVLRFTEHAAKIAHIPKILYHWRAIPGSTASTMEAKDYVLDAALRALKERALRMSGGGEARLGLYSGSFDLRYKINGTPLVSIVIPTAGRMARIKNMNIDLLAQVVTSIYEKSSYRNFEIIIVDNNDLRPETLAALKSYNCQYIHFDGEFNIATKMNLGARDARGEYLIFLNDDVEIISEDWIECMLQLCQRKGVGAVGPKLHFEDGTLQHVGVAFWNGLPDHIHRAFPRTSPGYFFSSVANRNYMAVTGAVLMTKYDLFMSVGGFDEQFAINYNDIDYCLKVFNKNFRIVFAAGAELFHYESVSRERVVAEEEMVMLQDKWRGLVSRDPYYSIAFENHPPNYVLRSDWLSIAAEEAALK